jgi:hypothetical protein
MNENIAKGNDDNNDRHCIIPRNNDAFCMGNDGARVAPTCGGIVIYKNKMWGWGGSKESIIFFHY